MIKDKKVILDLKFDSNLCKDEKGKGKGKIHKNPKFKQILRSVKICGVTIEYGSLNKY